MATATLEDVDDSLVPEYEDRYTAYKKLIIGLAEKLGSEDVLAIAYLENLPEDYKTLSPLGVLQRLERSNKFDQNHLSDLLYMLKSINRADLLNYVDEYRRKYCKPLSAHATRVNRFVFSYPPPHPTRSTTEEERFRPNASSRAVGPQAQLVVAIWPHPAAPGGDNAGELIR